VLTVQNLSKYYGDRSILQDVSLHIPQGEIYGLLGPNGAGKTTIINIICNLIQPDRGTVKIDGELIGDATKSLIGIAPQDNLLYKGLTCWENLEFFATLYGLRGEARTKQVRSCLEAVNLIDRSHSLVGVLSGGMVRRMNMAIALVHHPKLVILDEPTTGLDIEARYEIWELIGQLRAQGTTLLLTTHMLEEAERLCQTIGILKNGHLLVEGDLAKLRQVIPAAEIVFMRTTAEKNAIDRARELGFTERHYGTDLAFWLPEHKTLVELVNLFDGISIDSISIQPIRLEHIYIEITQAAQPV